MTRRPSRLVPRRVTRWVLGLGLALLAVSTARAAPTGTRFALVIGANEGAPDEPLLAFAERDAQRMAEVLQRMGGIAAENVVLLQGPAPDDVTRALAVLATRIIALELTRTARGEPRAASSLVLYFSGHADRTAFHLGHGTLPFSALKRALRELPTELTVVLVDACRAGGLIAAKGARRVRAEPIVLDVAGDDQSTAAGLAILTSSSHDEDAQESDRLRGGVFTHHLLSGLMGAADASGDGAITLAELRDYAYAQTLVSTSATDVVQHPAFAFDLRGQSDPILTRTDLASDGGRARRSRLVFADPGHYVVIEQGGERQLVSELRAPAGAGLTLAPGRYRVRRLEPDRAFEGEVVLAAGQPTTLAASALDAIPFRHAVRKGYGQARRRAWSLGLAGEVQTNFLDSHSDGPPGASLVWSGAIAAQVDFAAAALELRLRYGGNRLDNDFVTLTNRFVGVDLGAYHLFDVGRHGVGFGVRVGLDWLHQSFDAYGAAPAIDATLVRAGSFARAEFALGGSVVLTFDVGLDIYGVPAARGSELVANTACTAGLGLAFKVP